jgi:hypothetical protein
MEPIAYAVRTPSENLGPFFDLAEVRAIVADYRATHGDEATTREIAVFCLKDRVGAGGWLDVRELLQ